MSSSAPKGVIGLVVGIMLLVITIFASGSLVENVAADEIVVIQSVGGNLRVYQSQGPKWQGMGKVTTYKKRDIYEFPVRTEGDGDNVAGGVRIQFNDAGHGTIRGSIQYDMPTDEANIITLHSKYGSPETIKDQVVKRTVDKVIYMTGPLMSSRESYAEKRPDLINFVQDQIDSGIYRTRQVQVKTVDPISGQERTVVEAQIALDSNGHPARQEASIVGEFGIRAFNFAIEELKYSKTVEDQIQAQQKIAMDVQTSIAEARKAEQRKLTVVQEGEANAAKAKWEQEVVKAQQVTEAEMKKAVAELDVEAAEAYKKARLLRAEADATYRRSVMAADGYMEAKIDALKNIHFNYAQAIQKTTSPLVPTTVMGNTGGGSGETTVSGLIQILMIQAAKQLGLDSIAK